MRALKMRNAMLATGIWQLWIERDPLTTTWKVAEELSVDYYMVIWHLKQIEKVKKLNKWVSHELTPNLKKNCQFEVLSSLILCNNNEPFLNWIVIRDGKWVVYDNWRWPAQWLDRDRSSKALPKTKLVPQKTSWSLFGGLLPVQSALTFWIPAKPLHLRSMLSKSMSCTKNWSRHWSRKGPILHNNAWSHVAQPVLQKLNELGYEVLPHPPYSPDLVPTTTSSSILTTFCRESASTTSRRRKCFPRVHWIPKHEFLCYRNEQTYFSLAKMCRL